MTLRRDPVQVHMATSSTTWHPRLLHYCSGSLFRVGFCKKLRHNRMQRRSSKSFSLLMRLSMERGDLCGGWYPKPYALKAETPEGPVLTQFLGCHVGCEYVLVARSTWRRDAFCSDQRSSCESLHKCFQRCQLQAQTRPHSMALRFN